MKKFLLIIVLTLIVLPAFAKPQRHSHYEKEYQTEWCNANNGEMEVILDDDARVDCVTSTHAIEFDFAPKWNEAIGQALYYGIATNKKAGIVLILEHEANDTKFLNRVNTVAKEHNITVWTMTPEDLCNKK